MKQKRVLVSIFLIIIFVLSGCGNSKKNSVSHVINNKKQNETTSDSTADSSTLIVYYSYSGTTKRVAEHLQKLTGGTLYELKLDDPYTGGSNDVSDRVFAERNAKKMPKLSGNLPNPDDYDRILIGTPVWNDSLANPVLSFLQQVDFKGKNVAPFWTYITSEGTTKNDFVNKSKNAHIEKGLPIRSANGISDDKLDKMLKEWLEL